MPAPLIYTAAGNELASEGNPVRAGGRATMEALTDSPGLEKNKFRVTIRGVERIKSEQEGAEWCWAACAKMALANAGRRVQQKDLVSQFRSDPESQTANLAVIMRSLNPELERQLVGKAFIPVRLKSPTSDMIIRRLSQGELIVVGLQEPDSGGHACVLYSVTYSERSKGVFESIGHSLMGDKTPVEQDENPICQYAIHEVELYDPWPEIGVRKLTGAELKEQILFATSRSYSRIVIQDFLKAQRAR